MTAEEKKAEIFKVFHQLTNCHQAALGYFELNEFARCRILAEECRAEWNVLIHHLDSLIFDA